MEEPSSGVPDGLYMTVRGVVKRGVILLVILLSFSIFSITVLAADLSTAKEWFSEPSYVVVTLVGLAVVAFLTGFLLTYVPKLRKKNKGRSNTTQTSATTQSPTTLKLLIDEIFNAIHDDDLIAVAQLNPHINAVYKELPDAEQAKFKKKIDILNAYVAQRAVSQQRTPIHKRTSSIIATAHAPKHSTKQVRPTPSLFEQVHSLYYDAITAIDVGEVEDGKQMYAEIRRNFHSLQPVEREILHPLMINLHSRLSSIIVGGHHG